MMEHYDLLLDRVGGLLKAGRIEARQQINTVLVETYWHVGRHIVDFEQQGDHSAQYGKQLLEHLSVDLKQRYGKGFSRSNIYQMRQLYLCYPKIQTLSGKLGWSIYCELLSISDSLSRSFYEQQCLVENWSVRELKRQISSALFERLALSSDKQGILALARDGHQPAIAADLVKDPYVFEFLNLPERKQYSEKQLENQLVDKLAQFLLELGKGFAFIAQQYRVTLNNTHYYVDLVFYHRILKCFVLIDLKLGKVHHQDIGQMNLYLNYFKKEENTAGDQAPIGIVLAADKDEILVEYATGSISNQIFVSRYKTHLPDRKALARELALLLEEQGD
ncbi:YhcG family protein [Endozoicomonas sp.]|uniref:PDDEXK nuclease domain-containing protein n=1 Tax=Endozoicomonas sp. TaxID=1892382 RepID=UPI002883E02B|nr:PDDEXK nuclease domain-containing protein [Endozoicomonas sp.]